MGLSYHPLSIVCALFRVYRAGSLSPPSRARRPPSRAVEGELDLDQHLGGHERRLHGRARRGRRPVDPPPPALVHRGEVAPHVRQPHPAGEQVRLREAVRRHQRVGLGQHLGGLARGVLAAVVGDQAGEVDLGARADGRAVAAVGRVPADLGGAGVEGELHLDRVRGGGEVGLHGGPHGQAGRVVPALPDLVQRREVGGQVLEPDRGGHQVPLLQPMLGHQALGLGKDLLSLALGVRRGVVRDEPSKVRGVARLRHQAVPGGLVEPLDRLRGGVEVELDLHEVVRGYQSSFHGRANGHIVGVHPSIPHLVHLRKIF
ncbi:unnamed protein product [Heterosigma akashiwo]